MSSKVIGWVWDESVASGSEMLVLLALAEGAGHDGSGSCYSASTISRMTRLSERTVWRCIKSLLGAGEIEKDGEHSKYKTTIYRFPAYQKKVGVNLSPPDKQDVRPLTNTTSTPDMDGTQDLNTYPTTYPKDSPTPDGADGPPDPSQPDQAFIVEALCKHLAEWVSRNTGMKEKPVGKRWRDTCRRMMEIDGLDPTDMWHVLEWSQRDEFWQGNIQSMDTFRKQYGKLVIARRGKARQPVNKIREALDSVDREMNAQVQAPALAALDWVLPIGELD